MWPLVKNGSIFSVSNLCCLSFQGPHNPGSGFGCVFEHGGGRRQMVAGGWPLSPPPRTGLSAVMSSAGKHSQLCPPSPGTFLDERRRALSRTLLSRLLRRTNKCTGAYFSPRSWAWTASLMTEQVTPPQEKKSCCFLGNQQKQRHQCVQVGTSRQTDLGGRHWWFAVWQRNQN